MVARERILSQESSAYNVVTPIKNLRYERITTTIEREWLAQIVASTKKIEHRKIKPYWTKRFAKVSLPFKPAVERDESASAGSDRADPENYKRPPRW
jgi:hypothetical protein